MARLIPGFDADPEGALAAAADRVGLGPVPLFAADWYRARNAVPASETAIMHYMREGAAAGLDPHPLFDARHYLAQAPGVANPLQHFLTVGGPAGLDCHPLFNARWYWERNPDVRAAGATPILHYLRHGAAEGREPGPLFSSEYYLAQTGGAGSRDNPLLHFVLHGQPAGLSPHPDFRPDPVRRTFRRARREGALAAYLEVVGWEQAERAARRHEEPPDPAITPPPLAMVQAAPGTATAAGLRLLEALGVASPKGDGRSGPYHLEKLDAIQHDPAAAADFASALAGGLGRDRPALLLEGAGLVPPSLPEPPAGDPLRNLADRHRAGQFAAAERFRLHPARAGSAERGPVISVLMPVHRTPLHLLERAILSVMCQTYPDWELCLVDDGSRRPGLSAALARFARADSRIKLAVLPRNAGIAAASNRALALATGAHTGLLDHDDMLAGDALEQVAAVLRARPDTDLVYSDECMIGLEDVPLRLFPKPDWSPLLLTSFMYTGHFSVYRAALVRELGGFRGEYDLSQDYDLALRVAERRPVVAHIRETLYGWRMIPESASMGGKPGARASNVAALQSALDRRGWGGRAVELPMSNRIERAISPAPLVSIIVPSDDPAHIVQVVMSIVAHTTYERFEILVVARSAVIAACAAEIRPGRVRFVAFDRPFNFSAKCNAGAQAARGEHLVFYNDDVRVLTGAWIEALLEALTLPGVGAVAPKLLYEDNTIQHAGMVTGTRRLLTTAFHCYPRSTPAHFNMAQSLREVTLLSAACLAMPARVFRELGGFDAVNTPIAHSDVDLCLRLREAGLACVYTPHAELTHIGHQALGAAEQAGAFRPDKADIYLMRRFGPLLEDDPTFPPAMYEMLAFGDPVPFRYHAARQRPRNAARRGDALLVSHELGASGAPKVAFDMARALLRAGWHVLVMSPTDGPFRERLLAVGADVMIDPLALEADPAMVAMARNFDVVIGNTVLCWRLLPALAPFTRVFLYAHETGYAEEIAAAEPAFAGSLLAGSGVWAGSERSAAVLRRLGADPQVLEYGVEAPDLAAVPPGERDIVVAVLASIEPRKGQDLAVKAFALLPEPIRQRCRLRINGRPHDPGFAAAIVELARSDSRIELGPELDLPAYRAALAEADLVLCPSRDDTLPLVSLNALAAGKVLVVSREVGTSAYLEDGVSGFVLAENGPREIAAVLTRAVVQRRRWPEIGAAARSVFQDHFSETRFARRLLGAISEVAAQAAD